MSICLHISTVPLTSAVSPLSFLPRWNLTPVTATEDNNDGRQIDSSPVGATTFLDRPRAAPRRSLKDTSTLAYPGAA